MEVNSTVVNEDKPTGTSGKSAEFSLSDRQRENARMFDRIAPRYDFLNRLLSLRRDVAWRRCLANHLPAGKNLAVLDVATGTADLLISLSRNSDRVTFGLGLDLAPEMLRLGGKKLAAQHPDHSLGLVLGDGADMPFPDNCFDVVTIGFGIRNFSDVTGGLREFRRVLKPGGRLLVLEFSLPANRLMYHAYMTYFRYVLPMVGTILSGDNTAYRYLNRSVEGFPYGDEFCRMIAAAGFTDVKITPLTFGVASIYRGDKPSV